MAQFPNTTAADGIWTLKKVRRAILGGNWPAYYPPDEYFANTVLLLNGDGTNGGQNNTFLDSSSNAHTITRNGNVTQGSFSPFAKADGKWGNYFDGNDYLSFTSTALTGDFTIETWFYQNAKSSSYVVLVGGSTGSFNFPIIIDYNNSGTVGFYLIGGVGILQNAGSFSLNEWNHIAVTRSGTTLRMFLNGTQVGSATSSVTVTLDELGGWSGGSNNRLNGYMSNARIVDGTALYTSDFTPSTEPLTAITGTSLLTCQSNRFIDNSTNAHAITVNGNPKVTTFSPFPQTTQYSADTNGGSGYFDGVDTDFLSGTMTSDLALGTEDCTIEAWIYCTGSSSTNDRIFDTRQGGTSYGTDGATFQKVGSNIQFWAGSYSSGSPVISGSLGADVVNSWAHCRLSRISGTNYLYVNGSQVATNTNSWNQAFVSGRSFHVGKLVAFSSTFDGYISDFRIIKGEGLSGQIPTAPLTDVTNTSLLCNFTNASITDLTGSNVLETVGNAQVDTTTFKYGTGAMEFDGSGDYLVTTSNEAFNFGTTEDFTIECWAQYDGTSNTGIWQTSSTPGPEGSQQLGLVWYQDKIYSIIKASGTNTGSPTVSANTWYHLAVVRYNGTTNVYLDGTSIKSVSDTYNYTGRPYFVIGGYSTTSYLMNGYIDDFRITKGIARYTANFTPPTKELPSVGQ